MKDWVINKHLEELKRNGKSINENNKFLLAKYHNDKANGISKDESEARTLLILLNDSLINYVIYNKFNLVDYGDNLEEYTVCKMGLIKAVDKFDISKNVEFSTFAIKVMINEMYMHYRKLNSMANTIEREKVSIDDCLMEDFRGEPKAQFSHNFSDSCFIDEVMLKDEFEYVCKKFVHLKPAEQEVLICVFGLFGVQPMKHQDIANIYGKSRSYVTKLLDMGIKKLYVLSVEDCKLTEEQRLLKSKVQNQVYELNELVKQNIFLF